MITLNINVNKAPGPDHIPNWVLRDTAYTIGKPVCEIFISSVCQAYLPEIWKSANVTPINKESLPRETETDIRPTSLAPVLAKKNESSMGLTIIYEIIGHKVDPDHLGPVSGASTTHSLT